MSCFFEMINCCAPSRQCCPNRGSWNRVSNCCCRYNTIRNNASTTINNITTSREVAQFTAGTVTFPTGDNVLFSTTTFNNSAGDITLGGDGSITLAPGVYQVEYYATLENVSEDAVTAELALTVNGSTNVPSQSTNTIPATSTQSVSGSSIIFVSSGNTTNVTLTNVSADNVELTLVRANLIVTKIS